jgi:DNA-binding beta-propeller fold protein YncE
MTWISAGPRAAGPFRAAGKRTRVRRGPQIAWAAGLAVTACGSAAGPSAAAGHPVTAAPAAAAPFVYVAGTRRNEISQFGSAPSGSGTLRALTPKTVASGPGPYDVAVSPQGTSVYAVDAPGNATGEVSQYTLNPATGKLTPKSPPTVPTAAGPSGIIAVAPNGKNAYVPDFTAQAISQYTISPATGKLTPMTPKTVADPVGKKVGPTGIRIAPDGRYAYITNVKLCIVPKGKKCPPTTNGKANTVSVFRISPATGALSAKPVQTVATGQNPQMITIAPGGKSAYVAATGDNTIWQYSISPATGKLTPKSPATVATGKGPHDLAVPPDGKNLYVVTVANNTVSQYRISPHTGALSAKPASTAGTMLHPEAIVLAPDGKNAYVTSGNDPVLAQFAISPATGTITPLSPATITLPSGSLGLAITPAMARNVINAGPAIALGPASRRQDHHSPAHRITIRAPTPLTTPNTGTASHIGGSAGVLPELPHHSV